MLRWIRSVLRHFPPLDYAARVVIGILRLPRHLDRIVRLDHDRLPANFPQGVVTNFVNSFTVTTRELRRSQKDLEETNQRLVTDFEALKNRVEFIRLETLLEMRYVAKAPQNTTEPAVEARILNPEKVKASLERSDLRINVGCGHIPLADYVNVDMRDLPGVDVVAAADTLPWPSGSIHEIHSAHMLEHFPEEQLKRVILPHWRDRLSPAGRLRIVVPDAENMILAYVHEEMPFEDLRLVTFGDQEYQGDFHYTMFTRESLGALLQQAGFVNVNCVAAGRRNGKCLEMEFTAERGK